MTQAKRLHLLVSLSSKLFVPELLWHRYRLHSQSRCTIFTCLSFLVDTLSAIGFCSSYSEVLRFEKNAADAIAPDIFATDINPKDSMVLFEVDNVDHNLRTIDGKGTFHGIGMVAALTPDLKVVEYAKIDIINYRFANHVSSSVVFK